MITTVNWAEVLYQAERKQGGKGISAAKQLEANTPIKIVVATKELAETAAHYKAHHRLSLADAFAAALTKLQDGTLATGDPEFKPLEQELKIHWLKQRVP